MFKISKMYRHLLAILSCLAVVIHADTRVAVSQFMSTTITGSVTFTEEADGIKVTGKITGLPVGKYGFHIHELGDISSCAATGAHFNLDGTDHGGPTHDVRHVGDLGNVEFVQTQDGAEANIDFVDKIIALRGRNSIVGRAVVLHEREDDLGLGGHNDSLSTGNAGGRVACGVVGIKSPVDWNTAGNLGPSSALLLLIGSAFFVLRF